MRTKLTGLEDRSILYTQMQETLSQLQEQVHKLDRPHEAIKDMRGRLDVLTTSIRALDGQLQTLSSTIDEQKLDSSLLATLADRIELLESEQRSGKSLEQLYQDPAPHNSKLCRSSSQRYTTQVEEMSSESAPPEPSWCESHRYRTRPPTSRKIEPIFNLAPERVPASSRLLRPSPQGRSRIVSSSRLATHTISKVTGLNFCHSLGQASLSLSDYLAVAHEIFSSQGTASETEFIFAFLSGLASPYDRAHLVETRAGNLACWNEFACSVQALVEDIELCSKQKVSASEWFEGDRGTFRGLQDKSEMTASVMARRTQ